jgi:O-antigen/teichoic acid export membrane protein
VQAAVFIILSRALGIENYGAFAAILALASVCATFGALGTQVVMLREVSVTPSTFGSAWGKTLMTIALSTPVMLFIYGLLAWSILPDQLSTFAMVLIGVAEVVLTPVYLSTITAYQAHDRMGRSGWLTLAFVLPRLPAAILLWLIASFVPSEILLLTWAILYALSTLAVVIYSHRLVYRELGTGQIPDGRSLLSAIRSGLPFASGSAAAKIHSDIDKAMLARLSTLESTGAYSAGHRLVDLATIPIVSLFSVVWPRFFRAGSHGRKDIIALAQSVIMVPAAYALMAGLVLYFAADVLPWILGAEYSVAADVLRWLAWLPLVSLPRLLLQMMMASTNRQAIAVVALTVGAASNIALNLSLIPAYGWQGAVIATYAAEALIILVMLFGFAGKTLARR